MKCNQQCFECSSKGIGYHWLLVENALVKITDAPAALLEINQALDKLQAQADRVKGVNHSSYINVQISINQYVQFQCKLLRAIVNDTS